jgi:hypothetical protein
MLELFGGQIADAFRAEVVTLDESGATTDRADGLLSHVDMGVDCEQPPAVGATESSMLAAVASILRAVDEPPSVCMFADFYVPFRVGLAFDLAVMVVARRNYRPISDCDRNGRALTQGDFDVRCGHGSGSFCGKCRRLPRTVVRGR